MGRSGMRRVWTYPQLFSQASSGRGSPRHRAGGSADAAWRHLGSSAQLAGAKSSKTIPRFVKLAAALYLLLGTALLIWQAHSPALDGVSLPPADHRGASAAADGGQRSAAALLQSNRRMALQHGAAAALPGAAQPRTWAVNASGSGTTLNEPVLVEYKDPGRMELLDAALDAGKWKEAPVYSADVTPAAQPGSDGGSTARRVGACPQGDVRLFVAISSRCCTPEARAKRDAVRRTWLRAAALRHPQVAARFFLAQPAGGEEERRAAEASLRDEVAEFGDIVIVPGAELYRSLPSKTLRLLAYALASPCAFTHVAKVDDDVFLRPGRLLEVITTGAHQWELEVRYNSSTAPGGGAPFDGAVPEAVQAPWMRGMYVGKLDSNRSGEFPGWHPDRDPASKWYLDSADLADEDAPLGVRWVSGWSYLLSKDVAQTAVARAARHAAAPPDKRPRWWGRLPWEDILIAALLEGSGVRVSHHPGFKAAWDACDRGTVLKHLDWDAPALFDGLAEQERSGVWAAREVACSSGDFTAGEYQEWRKWRNAKSDNLQGGLM